MYSEITQNKRHSYLLIGVFLCLFVLMGYIFGAVYGNEWFGITFAAIIAVAMSLIGYFQGDTIALMSAGAKPIEKRDQPMLYNVVENLSIAQGMQAPKIYLIQDSSPNAFATGRDPKHASVAVTTGLLAILDKAELEGVLAHELSHIRNYDIRVMTLVVVLVGGIVLLSDWTSHGVFFNRRRSDREEGFPILLVIGLVLAVLSPLIAQLIKLAVSRSREYLADASGALLTRHPEGLARALEKIAAMDKPLERPNHATAHLFLANPFDPHVTSKFESLFSTHPPIEERIAKLRSMGV